jgi:AraC-like DNA-binding protein
MEWTPRVRAWSVYQVRSGSGYWLNPQLTQDLLPGTALVLSSHAQGCIRASRIGDGIALDFFNVEPERLTGMLALTEHSFLQGAACKDRFAWQVFPADNPVSARLSALRSGPDIGGCRLRLQLLQLFIEAFGKELQREEERVEGAADAKERLRAFLSQTPASDLLHMNFAELVRIARCTRRHLSRIFHEVVGMSFRDKHIELRLARACELLVTTESKVVDIALESGFQSLSLFNLMFKRRLGVSPGEWRQRQSDRKVSRVRELAGSKTLLRLPVDVAPPVNRRARA